MKKQLNAEGNYTEAELEEYMQSHRKLMIDSLWKLNVADIEGTLSRVCQMVVDDFHPFALDFFNLCFILLDGFILLGSTREQCKERGAVSQGKGFENSGQNFPGGHMPILIVIPISSVTLVILH